MSEFFEQLRAFSHKVFALHGIPGLESSWQTRVVSWKPKGAILHYTGGGDVYRTLRWFMAKKHNAKVSAHTVVDKRWPEVEKELAKDYPLVAALPTMVVECIPPDRWAWHANWMNPHCYGVELVNTGMSKGSVSSRNQYWDTYTVEQVLATIRLLHEVQALHGAFSRSFVLGHEQVKASKFDPGPMFPLAGVRNAAVEPMVDPIAFAWYHDFVSNLDYDDWWLHNVAMDWARAKCGESVFATEAWARLRIVLNGSFLEQEGDHILEVKTAMTLLGYWMTSADSFVREDRQSLEIFQRMAKLETDAIPGIKTRKALLNRLHNRAII